MSVEVKLEIESKTLETIAHDRGFDNVSDYLLSLVAADLSEDEDIDVAAHLREAIRDLKAGRFYPPEKLWDLDDIED